jgi:RNA polymerase sigma-70 factor, ECF subfamily
VDQITVEAARRGDRAAQAALLRALQDTWYRVCLGLLGGSNVEDARDAVQETGLRFLRELPAFRGQSSISTWSIGIAVNVSREIRRIRRPVSLATEDGQEGENSSLAAPATGAAPDQQAALEEERSVLRGVLQDLPQRQREALILRFFEDLSLEQAARSMDCAVGTVKATLHQAIRSLRRKLTAAKPRHPEPE